MTTSAVAALRYQQAAPASIIPPLDRDVERSWPMRALGTRCTVEGATAADRFDPYWGDMWAHGSTVTWLTHDTLRRQYEQNLINMPTQWKMTPDDAWRAWRQGYHRIDRLRFLAAVDMWRTLSAEQAMAVSGADVFDPRNSIAASAFAARLVDVGAFPHNSLTSSTPQTRNATVYRPSASSAFENHLLPMLTWPEQVSITGGRPWHGGVQFDRHNILATEMCVRAAEFCDQVGLVLGERFSDLDTLVGTGLGRTMPVSVPNVAADGLIVRRDGLRIAVEVTATRTGQFAKKVDRWAQVLSASPMAESGLVVLFLTTERPEKVIEDTSQVRNQTASHLLTSTRRWPGVPHDRIADRMFIADWSEWFPDKHRVSPNFLSMRALSPSGPASDPWRLVDLLDEESLPLNSDDRQRARLEAVIDNAQALAGVPFWMRDPDSGFQAHSMLLSDLGLSEVPTPPPTDSETPLDPAIGTALAGPAKTLPRLRHF